MKKHPGKALANMVLSCVLCSIAVNWVALPNGFVVTGITGLSMTAAQFTGVNYALIYYGLALAILLCTALTLGWREVWLCSPISAVFHNLGQLLVAAALLGSWTVLAYLPYLVVAGAASGLFTGLCAQLLVGRLKGLDHG